MARRAQSTKKVQTERTEVKNLLSEKLKDKTVIADTSALLIRGTDLLTGRLSAATGTRRRWRPIRTAPPAQSSPRA